MTGPLDSVRVMLWCTTCVPGMQLPLFAASAAGLFEARGLDVEFLSPVAPRDMSLGGLSVRVNAVDAGEAEFAVTGLAYLLAAQAEAGGTVGARFVASLHQRSPIAGIVPANSGLCEPAELAGRPTAGHGLSWMVQEYQAALAHNGREPGLLVDADDGAYAARTLERGEVDVTPAWVDTIPSIQQSAESVFRVVPLHVDVYATGLLAAERVSTEVAARMTEALAEGMARQQADPELGIDLYHRHYPKASKDYLRLAWSVFAPNGPATGTETMAIDRWENAADFYAAAHGLPALDVDDVCRPGLLGPRVHGNRDPWFADRLRSGEFTP